MVTFSTAVERSVANTTDRTAGFQRGYYDLEPFSCKSLCAGGEEVQTRGSFGTWGEQALRCTPRVIPAFAGHGTPKVSTTMVASGERVLSPTPAPASSPDKS